VAIACDIVIAAKSAIFGQPEIKLGFFPPYAAIRLPQLVGPAKAIEICTPAKAIEICTTGKRYTAEEAMGLGIVGHVAEDDKLAEYTQKLIGEIQANSPLIIRLNKRAVKQHLAVGLSKAIEGVTDLFLNTLMKTEDTLEGIKSFEEKRRPEWKNR
jgi:cyclohexa-1,5-dienecarbonyl-CoA hydratase